MAIIEEQRAARPAIRDDPLPQAGESLRTEIDNIQFDRMGFWILYLACFIVYAVVEWVQYFVHQQPTLENAIVVTGASVIVSGISIWKMRKWQSKVDRLALGLRGERHVGEYLQHYCRPLGYHIFHDIRFDGFNIDHLLIGPGGIFTIETKTWTKPAEFARLMCDAGSVAKPDGPADEEPIRQALAEGDAARKLLAEITGRDGKSLPVRPVIIFPGWYIDGGSLRDPVWVLADNNLHRILPREFARLSEAEVGLLTKQFTEWLRGRRK